MTAIIQCPDCLGRGFRFLGPVPAFAAYTPRQGCERCSGTGQVAADLNPSDCTCRYVHASSPTCPSAVPSTGAVRESERVSPALGNGSDRA